MLPETQTREAIIDCNASLLPDSLLDELTPYADDWERLAAGSALSRLDLAVELVAALRAAKRRRDPADALGDAVRLRQRR